VNIGDYSLKTRKMSEIGSIVALISCGKLVIIEKYDSRGIFE